MKASAAEVAGCRTTAAMLHVALRFHTAALMLHPGRELTDLTLLQRQQKICAVDWFTSYPGYETDLRAQRTSQKHSKSDLSTAPHCNSLNTPRPALVAKKLGEISRTSSSQSSAVLCRGFCNLACDMCESATGLEDGLTNSAAYGFRVNGIFARNCLLSGVCDCCKGSTAVVRDSLQDELATARARMFAGCSCAVGL